MGREEQIGLARHAAGRDVDDDRDRLPLRLAMAQRRERVGGLARLRDEEREPAGLEHRVAIAKLRRDIDVDGHARELFEPVFGDHAGIKAGAAGDDGDAVDPRQVEIHLRQRHRLFERADIGGERLRDDGRLLENLLCMKWR